MKNFAASPHSLVLIERLFRDLAVNFRGPDSFRVHISGFLTQAKTKRGESGRVENLYVSRDDLGKEAPHSLGSLGLSC